MKFKLGACIRFECCCCCCFKLESDCRLRRGRQNGLTGTNIHKVDHGEHGRAGAQGTRPPCPPQWLHWYQNLFSAPGFKLPKFYCRLHRFRSTPERSSLWVYSCWTSVMRNFSPLLTDIVTRALRSGERGCILVYKGVVNGV